MNSETGVKDTVQSEKKLEELVSKLEQLILDWRLEKYALQDRGRTGEALLLEEKIQAVQDCLRG